MSFFKVAILASGSKGNATLISVQEQHFLIDMGISCRELTKRMELLGVSPDKLKAVFITHEHIDHIKGLATFSKKYRVPIYSSELTWRAILGKEKNIVRSSCHIIDTSIGYNNIKIKSFSIPHDASDPHGYIFEDITQGKKFTYLTDTGFPTDTVVKAVENAEVLVLEANHDVDMLRNGKYPEALKRRILSTRGHLSNESAGWLLAKMSKLPQEVFLAHLSEENNRPSLALKTVQDIINGNGSNNMTNIKVASQYEIVSNYQASQIELFTEDKKE